MKRRVPTMLLAAATAVPGFAVSAQVQTPPAPNQQPTQEPSPTPPTPAPPPTQNPTVDETNAAADLLRRRLGLKPGPVGQPPSGPPIKPAEPPPETVPAPAEAGQEPAATTPPTLPGQDPQKPATQAAEANQEPKPPEPIDPTQAAARALQKLLPGAKTPPVAPMATSSGTPEPIAPTTTTANGEAAAALPPQEAKHTPPPEVGLAWRGQFATRYRARHGDGSNDQDLVARLSLDVGLEERDPFTFHVSARGFADLDGRHTDDAFAGLDQSFGNDANVRLYAAHLDAHRLPHLELARIGRQDLDETPTPITFDGLRVDSERFSAVKAFVSAYGGIPVHHFESASSGDSVYGLAGGLSPWHAARVRFDWMSLRDDYLATNQHDELLGVRWWQNLQDIQLHGLHTWRDGQPRDLQLGARGELALPLTFAVDYRELLTTQRSQVTEIDPFYAIALDYVPYRQLDATLSRDLGDHWTIGGGVAVRRLKDASEEGSFNREFERTHADVTVRDLGAKGLSFTLAGSLWNSQGEDFQAITGDLEYRPDQNLRVQLGTGYDLFRFDAFDQRERVHVRSYYLRSDYRIDKSVRVDAGYEYEREDDGEFHQFRLGVTWTF